MSGFSKRIAPSKAERKKRAKVKAKTQAKAQRKAQAAPSSQGRGKSPGAQHGRTADELQTYRPQELLDPARILARFSERAQQILAELPDTERPDPAAVRTVLRQAVLEAFRTREEVVSRLVEMEFVACSPEQNATSIRRAVRTSLVDMGVRVVATPEEQELFVVVEGEGDTFEVLRPAYVDEATGKLILSGQLKRLPADEVTTGHGADRPDRVEGEATK